MPKKNIFSWFKGLRTDIAELSKDVTKTTGRPVHILDTLWFVNNSAFLECYSSPFLKSRWLNND
jgi:hypothetical protein